MQKKWKPLVIILLLSVLIAYSVISMGTDFLGLRSGVDDIVVEITDTRPKCVAKALKEQKVIKHKNEFLLYQKLYRKLKGITAEYKTGKFSFGPAMSYNSIIRRLVSPQIETVTVTFKDGFTTREIAAELEKNGVCSANEFLNVLEKEDFDFWFLKEVPKNNLRVNRCEGYLFPDTYEFYKGEAPINVAKKLLENFDRKVTVEIKDKISKSGFSLDELIILASIVQKEEGSGANSAKVAGVFINRLNNQSEFLRLNSDVTIDYVERNIKPYLDYENQEIYDAYDTYKCIGLPAGPICNPSMVAIDAVLQPEKSDYFYFVTDKNDNYYWAKTLAEHNENIKKVKAVN